MDIQPERKSKKKETMDYMVRAIAADGQIRAFAATSRELTEYARSRHHTTPVVTAAMGRLLTGGAMMGAMMQNEDDLLTLRMKGDGPMGGLTVTADAFGHVKGYPDVPQAQLPLKKNGKLDVGGAIGRGTLQVLKDLGLKEPYSGMIDLQTGEIGDDLTYYFAVSEQVPSAVGLGVLVDTDLSVAEAGGFIIQLMPFAQEHTISFLENRMARVTSVTQLLSQGMTPEDMLTWILDGMDVEFTGTLPLTFSCSCSRERTKKVLMGVSTQELEDMIRDGAPVDVHCAFCNTDYRFEVDELQRILEQRR